MSVRTAFVALSFFSLVAAIHVCGQEAVVLRLDPPVGQVSRYRLEGRMWMRAGSEFPGDSVAPSMTQWVFTTQTVVAAESGLRAIQSVYDSSRMDVAGGMPGMPPDLLKGTTVTRAVDAEGHIVRTSVAPGPNLPPMMAEKMRTGPGGPDDVGGQSFPRRPLHVGDTWADTSTATAGGAPGGPVATMISTFRLESITHEAGGVRAVVSVQGGGGVPSDSAHASSVSGGYTMEMVIDVTRRRIQRMTTEQRTRVDSPGGPQAIRGTVVITLLEP